METRRIVSAPLAETARPAVARGPTPAGTYRAEPPLDAGLVAAGRVTAFPSVVLTRAGGDGARFRVLRVAFDGDTVLDRSFAYTPRPVPPVARDSLLAWYAGRCWTRRERRTTSPRQSRRDA